MEAFLLLMVRDLFDDVPIVPGCCQYNQYKTRLYILMNKHNTYHLFFPPSLIFCGLRHAEAELLRGEGGEGGIRTLDTSKTRITG